MWGLYNLAANFESSNFAQTLERNLSIEQSPISSLLKIRTSKFKQPGLDEFAFYEFRFQW